MSGIVVPSYRSGFYAPRRGGVAAHPEAWRYCVGAWNPGLGNTGSFLTDWSKLKRDGTFNNGPTWSVTGGQNALTMDGSDDYVSASAIKVSEITFEIWFYNLPSGYGMFINQEPTNTIMNCFLNGSSVLLRGGSTTSVTYSIASYLDLKQWTHLAVTIKKTTGTIFINGIKRKSGTVTAMGASTTGTTFGAYIAGGPNYFLDGIIGNFSIHSSCLSDSTMQLLARRPAIAYEPKRRRNIRLTYTYSAISGSAAGVATATGSLTATGALSATSAGIAAVTGSLTDGSSTSAAFGIATVTGSLTATGALSATSAGIAAVTGSLTATGALSATSAGIATVTGSLKDDLGPDFMRGRLSVFPHLSGTIIVDALLCGKIETNP